MGIKEKPNGINQTKIAVKMDRKESPDKNSPCLKPGVGLVQEAVVSGSCGVLNGSEGRPKHLGCAAHAA